jgi:ribosomal protein L11 methyltransferase
MTENQNNPEWLEISIDVDPIAHEALISFLIDLGCEGIVTEDFDDQTLKAYYPVNETPDSLRDRISLFMQDLADIFPEIKSNKVDIKQVEKQDWATSWRSFFSIDRVTDNLTIVPAWEQAPNPDEGRIILIDPGPAFGTGKHPTTRMCLMALEKASVRSNSGMLDVGTGSGILAVYGAML